MMARIGYVIKLLSGGLWGEGRASLEADLTSARCRVGGRELPCIPPPYIKGLLRRSAERLSAFRIIDRQQLESLFGPATYLPLSTSPPTYIPSGLIIGPAIPADLTKLKHILEGAGRMLAFEYLEKDVYASHVDIYIEPHVRLSDRRNAVAFGALFTEERILADSFYGEIVYTFQSSGGIEGGIEYLRLLILSLINLNYMYIGRRTPGEVRIASIDVEPDKIANQIMSDPIIKKALEIWGVKL